MSSLQLSLLLFSVMVRYQTSSIHLHPVLQKLAHKPTNKTEYSLFNIPSPIIGLLISFQFSFQFFSNSKIAHVKSTQPS